MKLMLILLIPVVLLSGINGCQGPAFGDGRGMTETRWLKKHESTANVEYSTKYSTTSKEVTLTVYREDGKFYHFHDGILINIGEVKLSPEQLRSQAAVYSWNFHNIGSSSPN